ncbi:SP0191 family lipoprotein [Streptococcus sobrinus]|uniref:SP0191 family lipoprotein n=2 Tax=Streptococcus sobrinus TaxID=1310 RepID=UPI000346A6E2|nr:putative lipoprotein [Streptococcus sobrinus]
MKRKIYTLMLASLLLLSLAACSNTSRPSSNSKSDSTSQSSKKESSHEVKGVSGKKTMQYTTLDDGVTVTVKQTIDYDGDKYKSIKLNIDEPLSEDVKKAAEGLDFNEVTKTLLEEWEKDSFIQDLKNTPGVTVNLDLSQDYHLKVDVNFDMTKADVDKLSQKSGLGINFTAVKNNTPLEYILKLAQSGAKKADN